MLSVSKRSAGWADRLSEKKLEAAHEVIGELSDRAQEWLSLLGFVQQQEDTGTWELDTLTIAEEDLSAADVTRMSADCGLAASILESLRQPDTVISDDNSEHDDSAGLQLRDFIKRR